MKTLLMFSTMQQFLKNFSLSKKQKFLLTALVFAVGQGSAYLFEGPVRLIPVFAIFLSSFVAVKLFFQVKFSYYWAILSFFPAFFSLSAGFINYYFPNTVLWFKVAFTFLYFFILYSLFLALNIFKVSASREEGIPLLNAAKTVLFLITTITAFFTFTVLLKIFNVVLLQTVVVVCFTFLFSYCLFTLNRGGRKDTKVLLGAALVAFVCFQVFLAFAFIPVETFFRGLIIAASFYVGISMERDYFAHKINTRLVLEYLFLLFFLGAAVFRFSME